VPSSFLIDDGIIVWFDGPEWDDVATKVFQDAADDVKSTAQTDAPWADRTGEARKGIDTDVAESKGDIVLTLFHTVDYGLWLEVIQSGRFATIMPTLEQKAPVILARAVDEISKARQGRN